MKIAIYQLDKGNMNMFRDWEFMSSRFNFKDYHKVYSFEVDSDFDTSILNWVYDRFNNGNYPEEYKGHSLSVSDIVSIDDNYYYCDDFGWEELKNVAVD